MLIVIDATGLKHIGELTRSGIIGRGYFIHKFCRIVSDIFFRF